MLLARGTTDGKAIDGTICFRQVKVLVRKPLAPKTGANEEQRPQRGGNIGTGRGIAQKKIKDTEKT